MADNIRQFINPDNKFPIDGKIIDEPPTEFWEKELKRMDEEDKKLADKYPDPIKYDFSRYAREIVREVLNKYPHAKLVNKEKCEWVLNNDEGEEFEVINGEEDFPDFTWTKGTYDFCVSMVRQHELILGERFETYSVVAELFKIARMQLITYLTNKK